MMFIFFRDCESCSPTSSSGLFPSNWFPTIEWFWILWSLAIAEEVWLLSLLVRGLRVLKLVRGWPFYTVGEKSLGRAFLNRFCLLVMCNCLFTEFWFASCRCCLWAGNSICYSEVLPTTALEIKESYTWTLAPWSLLGTLGLIEFSSNASSQVLIWLSSSWITRGEKLIFVVAPALLLIAFFLYFERLLSKLRPILLLYDEKPHDKVSEALVVWGMPLWFCYFCPNLELL